jgi:hypothetical protein
LEEIVHPVLLSIDRFVKGDLEIVVHAEVRKDTPVVRNIGDALSDQEIGFPAVMGSLARWSPVEEGSDP